MTKKAATPKRTKSGKARAQARIARDRARREMGGLMEDEFVTEQFSQRVRELSLQRTPDPRVVEEIERQALGKGRVVGRDILDALVMQGDEDSGIVEMRFSLTRIELTRIVRMPESPGEFLGMRLFDGHRLAHLMDDSDTDE
ncbi:MAG: hypothetical protein KBD16_01925 [Candidatus Pacebacteria bacterium]|nr:hypothetical protein [Candidatus Paceibacterota bacterium]